MIEQETERVGAFFDRRAEGFDAIYSGRRSALPRLWDRLTRRNLIDRLEFSLRMLEPLAGASVLDVGCGSGRYALALVARGAAEVVGVDVAPRMLTLAAELAREGGVDDRCTFVRAEVRDYRPGRSFDGVVAMGFFDYAASPAETLQHLHRLTGRVLVASFPARGALRVPFRKAWLGLRGCPVFFYSRREILELTARAGFDPVHLERSGPIYVLAAAPA
jgi:ubiquinone/menaquinone biosynthesis C-methylase UbiE